MLKLISEENLMPDDVERIDITVPPYTHKLVGHPFEIGDNPKVNAQFSIRYCVANALLRRASRLAHFEEKAIRDPRIAVLLQKIHVVPDKSLEARGHTALDMRVVIRGGKEYLRKIDLAPGFPGNELSGKDHEERFWDCVDFAGMPVPRENAKKLASMVETIESLKDIRLIIPMLISER
jgi:2-methylcitrate dehydratase PrpD